MGCVHEQEADAVKSKQDEIKYDRQILSKGSDIERYSIHTPSSGVDIPHDSDYIAKTAEPNKNSSLDSNTTEVDEKVIVSSEKKIPANSSDVICPDCSRKSDLITSKPEKRPSTPNPRATLDISSASDDIQNQKLPFIFEDSTVIETSCSKCISATLTRVTDTSTFIPEEEHNSSSIDMKSPLNKSPSVEGHAKINQSESVSYQNFEPVTENLKTVNKPASLFVSDSLKESANISQKSSEQSVQCVKPGLEVGKGLFISHEKIMSLAEVDGTQKSIENYLQILMEGSTNRCLVLVIGSQARGTAESWRVNSKNRRLSIRSVGRSRSNINLLFLGRLQFLFMYLMQMEAQLSGISLNSEAYDKVILYGLDVEIENLPIEEQVRVCNLILSAAFRVQRKITESLAQPSRATQTEHVEIIPYNFGSRVYEHVIRPIEKHWRQVC